MVGAAEVNCQSKYKFNKPDRGWPRSLAFGDRGIEGRLPMRLVS
jgi:hypothetical protein